MLKRNGNYTHVYNSQINRRSCIAFLGGASALIVKAQDLPSIASVELVPQVKRAWTHIIEAGGYRLRLIDAGGGDFAVAVGVPESINADQAIVTVFYRTVVRLDNRDEPLKLLRSEEQTAPLLRGALGMTRKNFHIPKEEITEVEIRPVQTIAEFKF